MLAIFALIFGLLFILSLLGIFIYSIVLRKKKQVIEERESFGIYNRTKEKLGDVTRLGYEEDVYKLIHNQSNKTIIEDKKSKVVDTIKKMYELELTSVDVSKVEGLSPLDTEPMTNMKLLSYKLDREGLYSLSKFI